GPGSMRSESGASRDRSSEDTRRAVAGRGRGATAIRAEQSLLQSAGDFVDAARRTEARLSHAALRAAAGALRAFEAAPGGAERSSRHPRGAILQRSRPVLAAVRRQPRGATRRARRGHRAAAAHHLARGRALWKRRPLMLDGGIHLTLLIGPGMPVPAPREGIHALGPVPGTSGTETSGFQLTFKVGKKSNLLNIMLPAGYFDPIVTRVIVIVTVNGLPNVLMDGVVTRQEIAPSNEVGKSTLTVTGEDLSRMMDLVEMPFMRFPAMTVDARVYAILAKYAVLGIAPVAIPPVIPDVSNPLEEMPSQIGTDLAYIRQLASQVGYVFYVEPGPIPGSSIAYFGPDVRLPIPQRALNVNMDAATNVESLSFSLDGTAKKLTVITVFDPETMKIPIPITVPNISILRPPLGARPTPPAKVEFAEGMGG